MVTSAVGGKIAVIGIDTTVNGGTAVFVSDDLVTSIVATFHGGDDTAGFGNNEGNGRACRAVADRA
ncbi:MAG: hypothetical protein KGQ61_05035 [Planctomycetes bacterium]|nr:hypothetical protein [Planctomycetota bacterium]